MSRSQNPRVSTINEVIWNQDIKAEEKELREEVEKDMLSLQAKKN